MSTPGSTVTAYPAADLERRFYAFVVDRLIAWGLFAVAGYLAYRFFFDGGSALAGVAVVVAVVLVVSVAFAIPLGLAGVTPGKAVAGLRVVRHADGRPLGVGPALLRGLMLGVAAIPTVGLGLATLAWTALTDPGGWRRGLHDRATDAVVVDIRPVPEEVEEVEERPRQIVNLTAMRLMPAPPPQRRPAPEPAPARPSTAVPASAAPAAVLPTPAPPTPAPPSTAPTPAPVPPPTTPPPGPPGVAAPPAWPSAPRSPLGSPASTEPAPAAAPQSGPPPGPPSVPDAVWRVAFDTGEEVTVEGLALVGRRPEPRPGEPVKHLIPLRSSDMSLSKTHAQFQVVPGGALVLMDRGSTNGSVVVRGGASKPLAPGRPITLLDGDSVRLGDRTMTVARSTPPAQPPAPPAR